VRPVKQGSNHAEKIWDAVWLKSIYGKMKDATRQNQRKSDYSSRMESRGVLGFVKYSSVMSERGNFGARAEGVGSKSDRVAPQP
jgi:hypothetical protein